MTICLAFVHKSKSVAICGKSAFWLINNKGVCWDCVAKHLINLGDNVDTATIKTIKNK
jgi:hypothetical protein